MGLRGPKPGSGQKKGGRAPGTLNKRTVSVKSALEEAAEKLGGVERIVEWAKEDPQNERVFWSTMYVKLLPLVMAGDPDNPLEIISRIERVIVPVGGQFIEHQEDDLENTIQ